MNEKKLWTGERLETHIFNNNTSEHLHRYALAIALCPDKTVLDIACGEGYGSNLMAATARNVVGVDISEDTILLARNKYKTKNVQFKTGSTSNIPLEDNSIDIVVSFETIEHHDLHDDMVKEIKRVLKSDGILLISSPDKKNYSDLPNYKNPYHIKELYFEDFRFLIKQYFKQTDFYFQKSIQGSLILPEDNYTSCDEYTGNYSSIAKETDKQAIYNICLAGDYPLPKFNASIFNSKFNKELEVEDALNKIKGSWSYKIGNFILKPFSYLKRVLNV